MRLLWDFETNFPLGRPGFCQKIPWQVCQDLSKLNDLLSKFNFVPFIDNKRLETYPFYKEEFLIGLKSFYYKHTCQPSRQISRLDKTQPLLPGKKFAKAVICLTGAENQWSLSYLKVLIYNYSYQSLSTSLKWKQNYWDFSSTWRNCSIQG